MRFLIQLPNRFSYKGLKKLMKVNDLSYPIDGEGTKIKGLLIIDTENLKTFTRILLEISDLFHDRFYIEEIFNGDVFAQQNHIDFYLLPVRELLDDYRI